MLTPMCFDEASSMMGCDREVSQTVAHKRVHMGTTLAHLPRDLTIAYVATTVRFDVNDRTDSRVVLRAIRVWLESTRVAISMLRKAY